MGILVLDLPHVGWERTGRGRLCGRLQRAVGLAISQGRVDGRVHLKGEDALNVFWMRWILVKLIVICVVHFAVKATDSRQL